MARAVGQLAELAGVDAAELGAFLAARWGQADAAATLARLERLRLASVHRAAARRRTDGQARHRAIFDAITYARETRADLRTLDAAFEWYAREHCKTAGAIRRYYYLGKKGR